MLEELQRMFVGHKVSITYSGDHSISLKDQTGVCKAVHKISGEYENNFDIELTNQHLVGIIVETKTPTSIEGGKGQIKGTVKIEVVP